MAFVDSTTAITSIPCPGSIFPNDVWPSSYDILAQHGHFPAKEQPNKTKDAFLFRCPFHADTDPSFSLHADRQRWKCWAGCGQGGPKELLKRFGDDYVPPPKPAPAPKKAKQTNNNIIGCTLGQLAKAKGLPVEYLRSLGWRDTTYSGKPAVAIPWPGGIHYRVNLDEKPKYLWKKGNKVSILGIERLEQIRRTGWVLIVEGETDYVAGLLMGLPVVAIPGASTWKDDWTLQFQGCHIYIWKEPGPGGESMAKKLAQAFWTVNIIEAPAGIKDLCELYDQSGAGARDFFTDLRMVAQEVHSFDYDREGQVRANQGYHNNLENPLTFPQEPTPAVKILDRTRVEHHQKENVAPTDIRRKGHIRRRDNDIRWDKANTLWPPDYRVPHAGKYTARIHKATFAVAIVKGYAHTWHHPENEKQKKRLIYFNVTPRMLIDADVFWHEYHHEDFDDLKYLALKKQVERADGAHNMLAVDNVQGRGTYTCFATVQIKGWERCSDVEAEFIKAIDHIRVPDDASRYQPVKGTQQWVKNMTTPRFKDADEWADIGYADGKDFDLDYVEAEARAEGIPYDETPVYKEWRKTGIGKMLVIYPSSLEEGLQFAASCGIKLKPKYREMLEETLITGGV
jgi:DNA primase